MDAFFEDISANNVPTQTIGPQPAQTTGPNNEFEELLSRSTQKLYPGCDMSTLEFTTEISHIKALHKITDVGFNKILALLQKACPPSKGYNFPSSYYEIKKTYKKIGLGYESIHACINDCFLFWGSEENLKMPNCPVCKESRYKKKTKAGKLLQELWKGVWTKDAATGTHFQMKAALLWTINDFPARSSLSGWSGQGYYACPTCNVDTPSMAVKNKIAYVGHRRLTRRTKIVRRCMEP
ncbi:protein kinase, ATP binding site-containing protein [Tanacetum coccineum]